MVHMEYQNPLAYASYLHSVYRVSFLEHFAENFAMLEFYKVHPMKVPQHLNHLNLENVQVKYFLWHLSIQLPLLDGHLYFFLQPKAKYLNYL